MIGQPRATERRAFLALGGGALALGALAACGSNTGRGGGGAGGGRPALAQWYHQYGEPGTEQAVKRYAASYDRAEVTVTWTPGDYDRKAAAALLTGSGPDVFESANGPTVDEIIGGQVVGLGNILGDAQADFNQRLVSRMSYQGQLYAVPQMIDMQLLVYRKSMLAAAGVAAPRTVDELIDVARRLTTDTVKGLFVGNDGGVGVLGGPALWSAGLDYLTDSGEIGFDNPNAALALAKLRELYASGALLLGAPTDWSNPSALIQGLTAMQWTGLWNIPALSKALGDDFGVLGWPKLSDGVGAVSVPIGAYGSCVSANSKDTDAARAYVQWLWVDQTDKQLDFAQSYGFHVPARASLVARAEKLRSGPAADAVKLMTESGRAQTPLLWTPAANTAYTDALSRIITGGADPAGELAAVKKTARAELDRVKGAAVPADQSRGAPAPAPR
jgi:multiple sugar transport system substrate-binding protein